MDFSLSGQQKLKVYETGGKMVGSKLILLPKGEPALTAYLCPAGRWTIGWGDTNGVYMGMQISRDEAEQRLAKLVAQYSRDITRLIAGGPETNQNQFDAFVLFSYNCGLKNFATSTLLKKHLKGDFAGAAKQFSLWNKGTVNGKKMVLDGLTVRRSEEAALYGNPVVKLAAAPVAVAPPLIAQPVDLSTRPEVDNNLSKRADVEPPKPLAQSRTIISGVVASVSALPITVDTAQVAMDGVKNVREQAETVNHLAWMGTTLGVIVLILSIVILYLRLHDREQGVK